MGVILKYIFLSIYEKKLRTFLILTSVAVASALFFASSAISDSMVNMFNERMKQFYGSSDFIIHANSNSCSRNFSPLNAKPYMDHLEYMVGGFQGSADYKHIDTKSYSIMLIGMDLVKHKIVSPVYINNALDLYPFSGKKIIISSATAGRFGWKLGDSIELRLNNSRQKFVVSGIASPAWFLYDDGESNSIIVPQDTLAALYNMRGRDNVLYVKLRNPEEKRQMLDKFRSLYAGCGFSSFSITTGIETPLMLLTAIVCFMSIFIIYTTFKVITLERLPIIGTFRSVGASRKTTSMLLLGESIIYGTTGGIIGCALGIGILYVMVGMTKNSWTRNMSTSISFTFSQLACAFAVAVVLCFISAALPIIKTHKISLKDLVLNVFEKQYKKSSYRTAFGVLFLIASLIMPGLVPDSIALAVDMGCLIMLGASAVMLIPFLTRTAAGIMENACSALFGNVGALAVKNLRENKSILNSISLLAIGISTLLMVTTATDSMNKEVINSFDSNYNFNINVRYVRANKHMEQIIRSMEGVSSVNGLFTARNISIKNFNENIQQIDGVGSNKYFEFWKINLGAEPDRIVRELDSGRNIILTNSLNYILGLKAGDYITLEMPRGERLYKIIGFYDTSLYNGNHGIISERYMKLDTGNRNYTYINVKTSKNPSVVADEIRKVFAREEPMVDTVTEMKKRSMNNNRQLSDILAGFAILTLFIGVIGILNNLLIGFINRKHSLAVLKSIGMSRSQTIGMIFIEALASGMVGGTVGTAVGGLQLAIVPTIMRAVGEYFPIHYNSRLVIIYITTGIVITLISSISPALKSSKLDIITSLKYE